MAGNSQRKGAVRKATGKKPRTMGSGSERRKGLKGKGPTPKAEDREGHKAHRRKKAIDRRAAKPSNERRGTVNRSRDVDLVIGRNPVVEALAAKVPAQSLQVLRFIDSDPRVKDALAMALSADIPITEASRRDLDDRAEGMNHQGLILTVAPYEYADFSSLLKSQTAKPLLLVALDSVTDTRNLGAIVRSAGAFGGAGVVIPSRRSAKVTAAAWRASAGALAHVPVAMVTNLNRTIEQAKEHGMTVVGLDGNSQQSITDIDVGDQPVMLVVGAEGKGLSALVARNCDYTVGIPISPQVESLNASVAAGIALSHLSRI